MDYSGRVCWCSIGGGISGGNVVVGICCVGWGVGVIVRCSGIGGVVSVCWWYWGGVSSVGGIGYVSSCCGYGIRISGGSRVRRVSCVWVRISGVGIFWNKGNGGFSCFIGNGWIVEVDCGGSWRRCGVSVSYFSCC